MKLSTIQYITQGETINAHLSNLKAVCEAGVSLVQLRLKAVPLQLIKEAAIAARKICDHAGATLIINDHPEIAKEAGADGVHLGQTDMRPEEARRIVGNDMIIGGTANTLAHCLDLIDQGVDYIGLGPFRHTTTKKALSPILGIEGYQQILKALEQRQYETPVYAIGGLQPEDVPSLRAAGVFGIAVSGVLTGADNKEEIVIKIKEAL